MSEVTMLVDQILLHINKGKFAANQKLPSEHELADQFRVPRMIVRKAYERLQELGYIYSMQGKGSFVKDRKKQIPLVFSKDVSFSEKMRELYSDYYSENVGCEPIPYHTEIYPSLSTDKDEQVYKIRRLRFLGKLPIALHTSYISESLFQDIGELGNTITSMFEYYRSKGYTDVYSEKSILSVIFPTEFEREILQCSSLVPLLLLESRCLDRETGTVLEVSKIRYRSDCFTYII
ncbi:GntR family transcriptional regulator [Pseudalkalibacillus decolorationis]|uniref:GntR family transcriptional regulator n=1 Tax=Pseudalkalibacillus decolorationis TaxID=163879 RepID=UPI0021475C28|nr:GntR family transcriptional regulator [Pseudalkalibacillus decolorationis]